LQDTIKSVTDVGTLTP